MGTEITVKQHDEPGFAIVRRLDFDDNGKIVKKYALTRSGNWEIIPEGEEYPRHCWLPLYPVVNQHVS